MSRLPRFDRPGRWFHVMNRGIARRVVFRGRADIRFFLALIAYAVRRGEIEVHAFVILPTHYHLLVRSPSGRLSVALRRIQNAYVRYFNRANKRDGPLFRGRFRSRPVLSLRYRFILVRYIDHNPVAARLAAEPTRYAHGSAMRHVRARRPRWLAGWYIDEILVAARRVDPNATYVSVWGTAPTESERSLVKARIRAKASLVDDLDDLVGAAPAPVLAWMRRKAALADGTSPGQPLVAPQQVLAVVAQAQTNGGPWVLPHPGSGRPVDLWALARIGLLNELAGLSATAISLRLGTSGPHVSRCITRHRRLLEEPRYAPRLAELAAACLAIGTGPQPPSGSAPAPEHESGTE